VVRTSFEPTYGVSCRAHTPPSTRTGRVSAGRYGRINGRFAPSETFLGAPAVGPPLASIHGGDSARVEQLFVILGTLWSLLCDARHTYVRSQADRLGTVERGGRIRFRVIPSRAGAQ
jgi:hypothetical protein